MELPGQKKKLNKKTIGIAALGVGVGIVAWIVIKRHQANITSTGDTSGIDPTIDPVTGIPYADEMGGGFGGFSGGSPGSISTGPTVTTATPLTLAQWAQNALTYMEDLGYNGKTVASALGRYLSGQKLTADQKQLVEQALGFVQAPAGAPPVHSEPSRGQGKPQVKVPDVVGKNYTNAAIILASKGLKSTRGEKNVGIVREESPSAGTTVHRGTVITLSGRGVGSPVKKTR